MSSSQAVHRFLAWSLACLVLLGAAKLAVLPVVSMVANRWDALLLQGSRLASLYQRPHDVELARLAAQRVIKQAADVAKLQDAGAGEGVLVAEALDLFRKSGASDILSENQTVEANGWLKKVRFQLKFSIRREQIAGLFARIREDASWIQMNTVMISGDITDENAKVTLNVTLFSVRPDAGVF